MSLSNHFFSTVGGWLAAANQNFVFGWGSGYLSHAVITLEFPQIIKLYTVLGASSFYSENIVSAHVWMQVKLP